MKQIYKTEKGFFKDGNKYCSLRDFFGDNCIKYRKPEYTIIRKVASDGLKSIIADRVIERNFKRSTRATKEAIKKALISQRCDLSYLQCFYTNGSNSLSGNSYDYCKRNFLKSFY